ncbi:MAG TPA: hypothetical protein VGI82_03455 [Chitinophagaceae bacterium]|jgi:hypothetical protein
MQQTLQSLTSSFRDPAGFVFQKDGIIYRQVNKVFKEDFDLFISSGCYAHMAKNQWLISHEELTENIFKSDTHYKTLKPHAIPFISYPYEWCFNMLKDAALLTLQLAKESIPFGIMLKDATPFNIQWLHGKPIAIDTLSFEKYDPFKPWIAYRQFCENFLSPLLLMHYSQQPIQSLMLAYPDGIPLSLTRSLLPWRSKFSFNTYLHIHLHEGLAARRIDKEEPRTNNFSEKKLRRLVDSLADLVSSLKWNAKPSTWSNYYEEANQRSDYIEQKKKIIAQWIDETTGLQTCIDLGANEGEFSQLIAKKDIQTISIDFDSNAINQLYQLVKKEKEVNILPLLIDLANPSPAIGFNNSERSSFIQRAHLDIAMALAIIHHLVIGKNFSFDMVSRLFKRLATLLIIEFIPKEDEKIQLMLRQKKDIYADYTESNFLATFEKHFSILKKANVGNSGRVIYLMKKKDE